MLIVLFSACTQYSYINNLQELSKDVSYFGFKLITHSPESHHNESQTISGQVLDDSFSDPVPLDEETIIPETQLTLVESITSDEEIIPETPQPSPSIKTQLAQDLLGTVEVTIDNNNNNPASKSYVCDICDKTFDRCTSLRRHVVGHTGNGHECHICSKSFYSRYDLTNHVMSHGSEKKFVCTECNKTYKTRGGLNSHKKEHQGNFKYFCDQCGKGFTYKNNFEGHKASHEKTKPFGCPACGNTYRYKSSLARHVCSAKRVDKLSCDECGKKFKSKRYLADHTAAHANPERYQCAGCGKTYKYRPSLYKHKKVTGHA
ncbi:zinc finger protein 80-like [Mytilus edulis]|uniref:zinc finger protein 80-like n=1 Tax=Mytilus edulis TaxID=6550 RepID=UPI0039EE2149